MCDRRESPARNRQREGESGPWFPVPPRGPKHTLPAPRGPRAARPELRAFPGVGLPGSDPGATPPPRKAAGAPTPDSGPQGALEAVLASVAPCRPPSARASPPPPRRRAGRRGQALHPEAWAAAAAPHFVPGWLRVRRREGEHGKSGHFYPHRERQTKSQALPRHSHPSKNVTPNRSHGAFPESAPGRKIPDAPQLGRLFRNLIPPNRIAKIGLRICNILED